MMASARSGGFNWIQLMEASILGAGGLWSFSVVNLISLRKLATALDGKKDLDIIQLEDIRKEYTLTLAKLKLAKKYLEIKNSGSSLEAADAVSLFVQSGLYEDAMSMAKIFEIDMKSAFESLTMKCLQLLASKQTK